MSADAPAPDPAKDKAAALKVLADDQSTRFKAFQAAIEAATKAYGFRFDAEPLAVIGQDGLVRYGARAVIVPVDQ